MLRSVGAEMAVLLLMCGVTYNSKDITRSINSGIKIGIMPYSAAVLLVSQTAYGRIKCLLLVWASVNHCPCISACALKVSLAATAIAALIVSFCPLQVLLLSLWITIDSNLSVYVFNVWRWLSRGKDSLTQFTKRLMLVRPSRRQISVLLCSLAMKDHLCS